MKLFEPVKKLYNQNPQEFYLRILSYFLSSIILPNIILLIFIIYMNHNNFFSYDFFSDGIFGMNLFFLMTIIFILIFSLSTFGFIVAYWGVKIKKWKNKDVLGIYIFNTLFLILIFLLSIQTSQYTWMIYLCILSFIINIHLVQIVHYQAKQQLISLILSTLFIIMFTSTFTKQTAHLISMGLSTFGTGGGIHTKITMINEKNEKGSLLLISPKFIYLRKKETNNTIIFPINNILKIELSKKRL